jgi:conjugal transfer pilus assembly protein TraE
MKYLLRNSRIQYLVKHRNGYMTLAVLSLISNIFLVAYLFYAKGYEKTVITPPGIAKSFWVSANQVSPEYLSEMGLFFANLRLNVTPSNAAMQRDVLLRYVNPSRYEILKTELVLEAEHLKKEHITTAFYPVDVKVDEKKLIVKISGDLQSTVGDTQLFPQRVIYQMEFTYHSGRLLINSFEEVKEHA